MAVTKGLLLTCLIIFSWSFAEAQDDPLQRRVSLQLSGVPLENALKELSKYGNFYYSYNASGLDKNKLVDLKIQNRTVRYGLEKLLGNNFQLKSGGNHVIIIPRQKKPANKALKPKLIKGTIKDAKTGKTISSVSIIELGEKNNTSTNQNGIYELRLKNQAEFSRILISRKNYRDTVILVKPEHEISLVIPLSPLPQISSLRSLHASIPLEMEKNGLFQTVVSSDQQLLSNNTPIFEQRALQLSFVPIIGTNKKISGLVENHVSLNLLGGYSMGLSGVEVAGLFNITRRHVRGVQLAGLMNITGGNMIGLQIAGFNNNIGTIHGCQLAGFYNLSMDSLNGTQISGFFNMARNRVRGVQAAGFLNISGRELIGLQASGFLNLSGRDAKGAQISGFGNIATGDMLGAQCAGFFNLSTGELKGLQLAGGVNVAADTTFTMQVGGIGNFAKVIYGTQISPFNIASIVGGSQLGLINYCDTVKGLPIGLISIVRKGIHQFEIASSDASELIVSLKTGTHRLYNILSAGMYRIDDSSLAHFGYGFGSMSKHRRKLGGGSELVASLVFNESFKSGIFPDSWFRFHPFFSWKPNKWLQFTAGPVAHFYWVDNSNISGMRPENQIGNLTSASNHSGFGRGWIGWQAGIRFF